MPIARNFAPLLLLAALSTPAAAQLKPPAGMSPGAPPQAAQQPQGEAPPQSDPVTREFRACLQKAQAAMQARNAEDPAALLACLNGELKRQESKIAGISGQISKAIPAEGKKRFEEANTAWRRYRDTNCLFLADPKISPQAAVGNADCMLKFTVQRGVDVERLSSMAAQRERADGSAPTPPAAEPAK